MVGCPSGDPVGDGCIKLLVDSYSPRLSCWFTMIMKLKMARKCNLGIGKLEFVEMGISEMVIGEMANWELAKL